MLTAGSPVQIFFFLLCDKTSLPGCYFAKSRDAAINRYLILIDERVNDPSKEEKKIEERKPRCYMPGHRVTHLPNRWGKKIDEARKRKRVKSVWWTGPTREGEWWGKIPWARFYNFFSLSLFSIRGPCKLFPPGSITSLEVPVDVWKKKREEQDPTATISTKRKDTPKLKQPGTSRPNTLISLSMTPFCHSFSRTS